MKFNHLFLIILMLLGSCAYQNKNGVANSSGWLIDYQTGCKIFTNSTAGRSVTWNGECKDGYAQGVGKYFFTKNGKQEIVISGSLIEGKLNGPAIIELADGSKYIGETRNAYINGLGVMTKPDGTKLEGKWENNKLVAAEVVNIQQLSKLLNIRLAFRELEIQSTNPNHLPPCPLADSSREDEFGPNGKTWKFENCWGTYFAKTGASWIKPDRYTGEFKNGSINGSVILERDGTIYKGELKFIPFLKDKGLRNGQGKLLLANGDIYEGEFSFDKFDGQGVLTTLDGFIQDGIWKEGKFVYKSLAQSSSDLGSSNTITRKTLNIKVTNTIPNSEGDFTINIQANTDIASLLVNGDEWGGKPDGNYSIKRVARAGQTSTFTVIAKDVYGNTDTKTLSVLRAITDSSNKYLALNPALIKNRVSPDAVAIIIGIQNYRRIPKADFASDDAKDFYDYAIRALGIKPENIKLLIDDQADDVEILATFQSWLPVKVRKQKSEVYVFYSGHGLPSEDGKNLYFLPYGTDKQYLDRTALNQQTIVAAIQAAHPKSVTMFIDACYSGQSRTGTTLLASARPISLKQSASSFPAEFTVFSASAPDQLSSSSPELKHGVFSYYLMKGMEGDADENHDGKITNAEMQNYLRDMVSRQALTLNRKQDPQLMGDAGKVLVGR